MPTGLKQIRISVDNYDFLTELAKEEARSTSAQLGVILNKMRQDRERKKSS